MGILGMILLILVSLVIILVLCLFIKITVDIKVNKPKEEKINFNVTLSFLKGIIKKDIPLNKEKNTPKEKSDDNKNKDEPFIKKIKTSYNKFLTFKYTLSKVKPNLRKTVKVKEFKLDINFGTDDAFDTGIMVGSLWAGIYNVIAFISNFVSLTEPQIKVNPDFQNKYLELNAKAKITLRPINLITLALKFIINYYLIKRKLTKKQEKKEKAAINYANSN